jgi:hypothetical protein
MEHSGDKMALWDSEKFQNFLRDYYGHDDLYLVPRKRMAQTEGEVFTRHEPRPKLNQKTLDQEPIVKGNLSLGEDPAREYTILRKLVDHDQFTDPFTERCAIKILDAASYFNPDLIHADDPAARRRIDARMKNNGANLTANPSP